jgi:hypothetical protein
MTIDPHDKPHDANFGEIHMSKSNETPAIEQLAASMSDACRKFERIASNSGPDKDAMVVLIRALHRQPTATAAILAAEWVAELGDHPVNEEAVSMALELRRLFGAEWYVTCAHYRMRENNENCRGEGDEDFALYGDDVEEVRDMWAERFESFDRKRAGEEEAAQAWLKRQARKAA